MQYSTARTTVLSPHILTHAHTCTHSHTHVHTCTRTQTPRCGMADSENESDFASAESDQEVSTPVASR